jgi:hypothetical protein
VQSASYCEGIANDDFDSPFDTADQMCAVDAPYDDQGTCQGDSGGPLVARDATGETVQIGLTTWGPTDCSTSVPGFFTSVLFMSSWISSEVQAMSPPTATTDTASGVSQTTATLGGAVNPETNVTTYYFQYGTTTGYGGTAGVGVTNNGLGDVAVSAALSGLTAGTTYHYRLVAQSANGTTYGADETLTTTSPPPAAPAPPPPAGPEAGIYRGNTNQRHQPIRITVGASQTKIPKIYFGFGARCSRHRGEKWFTFNAYGGRAFPLNIKSGLMFNATFVDSSNWRYTFHGTFTTTGTAAGTFTVTGRDRQEGLCRSGPVSWSAKL